MSGKTKETKINLFRKELTCFEEEFWVEVAKRSCVAISYCDSIISKLSMREV